MNTTYYIYEVPTEKNGATHEWEERRAYNFETYNIEPIIVETIEGPDNEDTWQIVGDREWELADLNGYERREHYFAMRIKGRKGGLTQGNRNAESGQIQSIASLGGSIGGKISGKMNVESGHLKSISSLGGKAAAKLYKNRLRDSATKESCSKGGTVATSKTDTCPHCNHVGKMPSIYRNHFKNCKLKA